MHRLENRHAGGRALVFFGGPSVLENKHNLSKLAGRDFTVFLESKALTRRFLDWRLSPEYYLIFYPEKSKSNSFQMVALQALLSKLDLRPLVHKELHVEIERLESGRRDFFEPGKQNITHKRLRWKPDVFLPNSPFELLPELTSTRLIAFKPAFNAAVHQQTFSQPVHLFDTEDDASSFSLHDYFHPQVKDGSLVLRGARHTNSAAIALYPLLKYMGFKKAYFVGADMSMLGSMEHAAPYTFLSMESFRMFFERARRAFGTHFPASDRRDALCDIRQRWQAHGPSALLSPFFLDSVRALALGDGRFIRPRAEMRTASCLLSTALGIEFINVYSPYKHSFPAEGICNISFDQLLRE
ncbi:MAG: hypothetical protein HQL43_00520 [Alphaproteobacteria bacterium]|nr:hypothetical protein [Alphaproteobacteria bacterium]